MRLDLRIAQYVKNKSSAYLSKTQKETKDKKEKDWQDKFENGASFIHQLAPNIKINLFQDSLLSRLIYKGFEEDELSFLKKYLKSGDVFLDVGTNIGLFSLYASNIVGNTGEVHCFEPTPITFDRLITNIKLNSLDNIKANNIGISDVEGVLEFNVSLNGYDAWNSFAKLPDEKFSDTIKVNTTTLNKYLAINKIVKANISLVKIDVEGWEKFVLNGATDLLTLENAPAFMVEFTETNTFSAGYMCQEIYDLMVDYGFKWYRYSNDSKKLIEENKQLHYPYDNLIALKDYQSVMDRIKNA